MENYIGLIIAIENYHDSKKLTNVQFAKNDAAAVIESLVKLGCNSTKFEYLEDNFATKTTITQKLKEIFECAT